MYFCLLNILATLGVGVTNGLPEIVKIGWFQKSQLLFTATRDLEEKQTIHISQVDFLMRVTNLRVNKRPHSGKKTCVSDIWVIFITAHFV